MREHISDSLFDWGKKLLISIFFIYSSMVITII